jgi:hypothetical protein
MTRRPFSSLSLKDAYELVPIFRTQEWDINPLERAPSDILLGNLQRFKSFALTTSEAAKVMLIDALIAEIVPLYPRLKVWKGEPLEMATVGGVADYLIARDYGYVETPLLCAIEAKRDDFVQGEAQCIAEMAVCQQKNAADGHDTAIHGIVSNGQGWVFYRLTRTPEVFVSGLFTMNDLPKLLGALDHVIAACAENIP